MKYRLTERGRSAFSPVPGGRRYTGTFRPRAKSRSDFDDSGVQPTEGPFRDKTDRPVPKPKVKVRKTKGKPSLTRVKSKDTTPLHVKRKDTVKGAKRVLKPKTRR